jgi:tRNA-specific 2-thiouridylase
VAAKDPERNALIVVQDPAHPWLMSQGFEVEEVRWLAQSPPAVLECAVKTRYRQPDLACRLRPDGDVVHVTLKQAANAVTPGQYAVFYAGEECLGGGVIARCHTRRGHRPSGAPPRPLPDPVILRRRADRL